jgi:hypothetical protein
MKTTMTVAMPDGSVWGFPVAVIANNRAERLAHEFGGDVERSLNEGTLPLFEDTANIKDWAENHMVLSQTNGNHSVITEATISTNEEGWFDYQDGWANGAKDFID